MNVVKEREGDVKPTIYTKENAKTIIDFGLAFGIEDRKYWENAQKLNLASFDQLDIKEVIDMISLLKDSSLLNIHIMRRAMNRLSESLHRLNIEDLTTFVQIYTSSEGQEASRNDPEFDKKLTATLIRDRDKFNHHEVATIANCVTFSDSKHTETPDFKPLLDPFFIKIAPRVNDWVTKGNVFDLT